MLQALCRRMAGINPKAVAAAEKSVSGMQRGRAYPAGALAGQQAVFGDPACGDETVSSIVVR